MITCKINKTYHSEEKPFSLNIDAHFKLNSINILFGTSGAGKTSLLRLISGLDKPDSGSITYKKTTWYHAHHNKTVPVSKRNIAYVFQDYALFPNMTVLQNIQFAHHEKSKALIDDLIINLEIKHIIHSKPSKLSGGQKQRVALARAIAQKPDLLLLDEPLTAIDEVLRKKIQSYLKALQKKLNFTIIMVSHNLQEVLNMADYVVMMNYGEIIDEGKPEILLSNNTHNTLRGTVLKIDNSMITVLIATQTVKIERSQVISADYVIGDQVDVKITP
ncbi:ATP-binding cassette domain-containing protein [Wenyingzhuangia sp. IMCC45533]